MEYTEISFYEEKNTKHSNLILISIESWFQVPRINDWVILTTSLNEYKVQKIIWHSPSRVSILCSE